MAKSKLPNSFPDFVQRRRAYVDLAESIRGIKLSPYEDSTVMARTILDAASEEENAAFITRPHIAIVLREGGSVKIERKGSSVACKVEMPQLQLRASTLIDFGSCSVDDPDGSIYAAASESNQYVTSLFNEFGKKNG